MEIGPGGLIHEAKKRAQDVYETVANNQLVQTGFLQLENGGSSPGVDQQSDQGASNVRPEEGEQLGLVDLHGVRVRGEGEGELA